MTPSEFRTFMGHFYDTATKAILKHDGLVDKIVGDEVIGLFFGGVSGPETRCSRRSRITVPCTKANGRIGRSGPVDGPGVIRGVGKAGASL